MKQVDTVVVGAGVSGLVAATELVRAGRQVLCLEARPRPGGRALSVSTRSGPVDLGATWYWPGEDEVSGLARSLGVSTFPQHLAGDVLLERPIPAAPAAEPTGEGAVEVQRVPGNPIDVPSYRFTGGAGDLVTRLAGQLPNGVLQCATPIVSIAETAGGVIVRSLTPDPAHAAVAARSVVLALPPALAVASIDFPAGLDPQVAAVATQTAVWMGEVVKAVAVYETAFWRSEGLAGAAVSYRGPFREFHDMSGDAGTVPALFGFAPSTSFASVDHEEVQRTFLDQLVRLFGDRASRPLAVLAKDWGREEWTTPPHQSAAAATVVSFGHPIFSRANPSRTILWASTETSELHAGHLDGAVHAGARVARTILTSPEHAGDA
ncbi:FAD-dependent oxidoreductase [Nocardioides sp. BGMRC 2183]|nr:FAD-dependent oxidoreductase [Nocardioides sp. BGMRC 2183]